MKIIFKSALLITAASLFLVNTSFAQSTHSCCQGTSTTKFAMLGKNESFKSSHLSPLPFHFVPSKGKMVSIKTSEGKEAMVFEVKADKHTDNYIFVIHEWWGLNDYIKQEAEKLQQELGSVHVIALDLYDGKIADNKDDASKYMSEAKEERIRAIITGAITYAGTNARIQTIGWCFGGGWSLQASIMAAKQGAGCVMYYGMPETDLKKMQALSAPVLGIFASQDGWITPEKVSMFETEMKKYNKEITVRSFNADHAFANPSNPKFDKAASDEAHQLSIKFLKEHLVQK